VLVATIDVVCCMHGFVIVENNFLKLEVTFSLLRADVAFDDECNIQKAFGRSACGI
jgi:hypothetical protein